ncbi:MAG TPA: GyrI-like domain-containing protein [Xanthobacteraceae bacterium]|jgi:effector-binding domain-containing protein|nr:GyrI-like domain-containing protein [Xanthobacteraceae bacterium]
MAIRFAFIPVMARLLAASLLAVTLTAAAFAQETKTPAPKASQDPFGEEVMLPDHKALFRHSKTSWEEAWANLVATFKAVRAEADRLKLKAVAPALVIYRSTSDEGFEFDAALPIETDPASPPGEDFKIGQTRTGKAIKFVYRGPFDAMDSTYENISNFIDSKRIDAEDLSIEEYVTDPTATKPEEIVINIYMPLKSK